MVEEELIKVKLRQAALKAVENFFGIEGIPDETIINNIMDVLLYIMENNLDKERYCEGNADFNSLVAIIVKLGYEELTLNRKVTRLKEPGKFVEYAIPALKKKYTKVREQEFNTSAKWCISDAEWQVADGIVKMLINESEL